MKKLKPYLLTSFLVLGILLILFLLKGIYPFGKNSLIWGDMHDQITAFYYHFQDSIKGNSSLLIDFSTSGGINFLGILAYYILSPFNFLVLLCKRENIYLMVSVIIAFKILTSSLTCLYFIRKYFKNLPYLLGILLAIIYAFSGYSLMMYQITPWIDAMYMLPLIIIGLNKVLDLESPKLYIITLALSLIFSFYVTVMTILFIFLASFIYLLVYKDSKEDRKKAILSLGISTIFSFLLSFFIVVPSYMQISISSRIGFNLNSLLNSGLGPITDKLAMLVFGGIVYVGLLLLLKNYKSHKKFLSFYIPVFLITLIPFIIEPVNKFWHFGSYAFFPCRYGFITMFTMIVGGAYLFNNFDKIKIKGIDIKHHKMLSIILTIFISVSIFIMIYSNYQDFQIAISHLTISRNHTLLLVLMLSILTSIIGCFMIIILNKKLTNFSVVLITIISLVHILSMSSIYLGIDCDQENLTGEYIEMNSIYKEHDSNDYYRLKTDVKNITLNNGIVTGYHNLDHFTSLIDKTNIQALKKMGYSSMWVMSHSKGGNLFLDSILANKYLLTDKKYNSEYYQFNKMYGELYFYSLKETPSYGYFIKENDTIFDKENSFTISNSLYKNITNSNDNIFKIIDNFELSNIEKIVNDNNSNRYNIIDHDRYNYAEANIEVSNKSTLYLEVLKTLVNTQSYELYENFNIYINDRLYAGKAFSEHNNGVLDLGTYENKKINIKVEFINDVDLQVLAIGVMDNSKYEEFVKNNQTNLKIDFKKNKITVNVDSDEKQLLFLPIAYNKGYKATNNNQSVEVLKLYDNFIGIELDKGTNNIELTFMPKGFIPCLIISIISLILITIILYTNLYQKLIDIKLLNNLAYYIYLCMYLGIVLVAYIGLILCFIISYFVYIRV